MPPKAILFLDQYSGLSGGQKVLLDLAQACTRKKWRVVAGLPEPGPLIGALEKLSIRTYLLPIGRYTITRKNAFDLIKYAVRLPLLVISTCRLIKKENIALVYANGARTFPWATIACAITRKPLFWHIHSIFSGGLERSNCLFFGKARCVKTIFAVSEAAARPLAGLRSKIKVMHNAVEVTGAPAASDALRKQYNAAPGVFCAAVIAILEDWKNQEDLVRAAGLLKKTAPGPWRFFLIGESLNGEERMQAYKKKLHALVRELSLENEVIFTGFRTDIRALLPTLDALVICSKIPDPCPLVALEAAAAAVPIISTDFGGTREIFAENEEALFYQAQEIQALADKLLFLSQNRAEAKRLGARAKEKVMRDHRLDAYLAKITDQIDKATR